MTKPEKLDLYRKHKDEYVAPAQPVLIEAKPALYLAVVGAGEPGGKVFQERIGALYSMAYTIKMTRQFEGRGDYVVCKLEAQWWLKDGSADFSKAPKSEWQWKLLIRTPDFIVQADLDKAVGVLTEKGKSAGVKDVRLERIEEGRSVQMLHVGPYDREQETIAKMLAFAGERGLKPHGRHHEIYLSDPRRVPPERLKTILRLPVKAV